MNAAEKLGHVALVSSASKPMNILSFQVFHSIEAATDPWGSFEVHAVGTLYQSLLWCRAWAETAGGEMRAQACIVIATNQAGAIQFILPLQIRRRQGIRVLEWLGSPHINYGYGLYAKTFLPASQAWFAEHFTEVAAATGSFDAISLTNMPDRLFEHPHPLSPIFNMLDANLSFSVQLSPDFDALHRRKRSGDDRRTARKKEASLARQGEVTFGLPKGKAELHDLIDIMFEQQAGRLAERGVHGVFGPMERQFIHRLAELQDEDRPVLAPYHLRCDGKVLAVMLGGVHSNGYWALISSLAAGPMRKYSPGDLALRRMISACSDAGLQFVDLSAGDAPYKRAWSDDVIRLHATVGATNLKGLAWTIAMSARLAVKRRIKNTPTVKRFADGLRRKLLGNSPVSH